MSTEWNINSDIYNIVDSVSKVRNRYIEDEDETTLSLGIFGFVTDTESKKIQTATIMAGQLGNEMFPTRAKLTKNVLTHAAYNGITDINAVPASITTTICVKVSDVEKYSNDSNEFFLESDAPIFIGEYEFHLDYDVKIYRKRTTNGFSYSAQYILHDEDGKPITNRITNITNPYIKQPFIINIGKEDYIGIQVTLRQITIEETNDTMKSDSIVENKTYTFEYENQLADFMVYIKDGLKTTEVTPYLYGSAIDPQVTNYCWYLYGTDNSIRITFDSKSFIPGLSSDIYIKAITTLGDGGNFSYINIDDTSEGLYVELTSQKYSYKSIMSYLVAVTDSENGTNKKSKEELQKLIPKAAMSRGSITTETDINNYFNLINTDINRLLMRKKLDNQASRVWYGFFMLKDINNNIIPTNTIDFKVNINDSSNVVPCGNNKYLIPAGTVIKFNPETLVGDIIDESKVPDLYTEKYFNSGSYYYMTIYDTAISKDPLHASYYMTIFNYDSYFTYEYVNEDSDIQFIANRFHFERDMLTDQGYYNIGFSLAQSIADSSFQYKTTEEVTVIDEDGNPITKEIVSENLKVVMVLYKSGVPYRWKECTLNEDLSIPENAIYRFDVSLETDNVYDDMGNIKIINMCPPGNTVELYGFLPEDIECEIYVLANVNSDARSKDARKDIDNIAPGYEDYTVTNIYKAVEGIHFFENYTNITDTTIDPLDESGDIFMIQDVPVVGRHYIYSGTEVKYLIDQLSEKKAYIDYCLNLVENSVNIDFKFFNTYGPSRTYFLEDEKTKIGNIDIYMKFKLSVKDSADANVKNNIIQDIKASIENLDDLSDWHAPNLITEIMNKYATQIYFLEFVGFNVFGADDQHIIKIEDSQYNKTDIPEFINIRNILDEESNELVPMIEIEIV